MKTVDELLAQSGYNQTITATIMKIDVVGKALSGGYHVDVTIENGAVIEVSVDLENLELMKNRIFESALFVVRKIELEQNRYECVCVVYGKASEQVH